MAAVLCAVSVLAGSTGGSTTTASATASNGSTPGYWVVSVQRFPDGGSFHLRGSTGGITTTAPATAYPVSALKIYFKSFLFQTKFISFPLLIAYYDCY